MKKIAAINKVWFYIICVVALSVGLTSCETNDDDVSRLISGGSGGPAPEQPFALEGTWVMGGMDTDVTLTILGQSMDMSESIEGLLLGVLNGALPVQYEKLSDLEIAVKIEPGAAAGFVKFSSPTLDLLLSPQQLALDLPKVDEFTIGSEGMLALLLKSVTILDYVTDETPDGVKVAETPLAMLAETLGEKATLKSVKFEANTSSIVAQVSEETRTGKVVLTVDGKLIIDVKNGGLAGIFMKNVKTHIGLTMDLKQWTALKNR